MLLAERAALIDVKVNLIKNRLWVHEINKHRLSEGEFHSFFNKLKKIVTEYQTILFFQRLPRHGLSGATTRLRTFTFFTTRLRKNAQFDCAHIFWLLVMKIPSIRTRMLTTVDYYNPHDYESCLLLLFCLIY
jgi:hypothetical protein